MSNHSFVIRRGAAYDSIETVRANTKDGEHDVIDLSRVKANIRQVIVDEVINRLRDKGFFQHA